MFPSPASARLRRHEEHLAERSQDRFHSRPLLVCGDRIETSVRRNEHSFHSRPLLVCGDEQKTLSPTNRWFP